MTVRTGVVTGSTRTTIGAVGEMIVCGIIAGGSAFLVLLGIAAAGGLELLAQVAR